jgi:uncharacterized protein (TIGR00369 family)
MAKMTKTGTAEAAPRDSTPALDTLGSAAIVTFEPEFLARLKTLFEELIVFNRTLGLQITGISPTRVTARIAMRPELIGHHGHQRLHGGVVSATLDALGGLAVMAAMGARHMDESIGARLARFGKLGTIDLRVDFLRQALGAHFTATAELMRLGSRVASTRMEFFDAQGRLLSTGAAAYIVS